MFQHLTWALYVHLVSWCSHGAIAKLRLDMLRKDKVVVMRTRTIVLLINCANLGPVGPSFMTLDGVGAIQLGAKRLIQLFVSMWQLRSAQVNFEATFSNNGPTLKDELRDCDSLDKLQRCVVMSCRGFTCWASSTCLTQMTNHGVLAETTSEYIIFFHQFFLLVRLKIWHHRPRTSLSHILPCELAQCPIYYRNTATDALAYTKTNFLCVKSVMKSQCCILSDRHPRHGALTLIPPKKAALRYSILKSNFNKPVPMKCRAHIQSPSVKRNVNIRHSYHTIEKYWAAWIRTELEGETATPTRKVI